MILDDIGYVQQDREEMEVLFTFLAERYERRSVLITSNLVFSQWDRIFKDPMTTACAIDRVVHHAMILELTGSSYRSEAAKQRNGRRDRRRRRQASEGGRGMRIALPGAARGRNDLHSCPRNDADGATQAPGTPLQPLSNSPRRGTVPTAFPPRSALAVPPLRAASLRSAALRYGTTSAAPRPGLTPPLIPIGRTTRAAGSGDPSRRITGTPLSEPKALTQHQPNAQV